MNLRKIVKYVTTLLKLFRIKFGEKCAEVYRLGRPEGRKEEVEEDQGGTGRTV